MFPEQTRENIEFALLQGHQDLARAVDYLLNGEINNTGQTKAK